MARRYLRDLATSPPEVARLGAELAAKEALLLQLQSQQRSAGGSAEDLAAANTRLAAELSEAQRRVEEHKKAARDLAEELAAAKLELEYFQVRSFNELAGSKDEVEAEGAGGWLAQLAG